jgi:Cu/Ag efflux protein CusF
MIRLPKWLPVVLCFALLVGLTARAYGAEATARGKIKTIEAEKKQFVLTDLNGKDWTFTLADNAVVRSADKDTKFTDLKAGDEVSIVYDKGITQFTAQYILDHKGDNKGLEVGFGSLKLFDADKKQLVLTDPNGKDWTFQMADGAKIRLADKEAKPADLKLGDKMTVVFEKKGNELTIQDVHANRK